MKEKHGWNTWDDYLKIHENVLEKYIGSGNIITSQPKYEITKYTEYYYELTINKLELLTISGNKVFIKIEKDVVIKEGARKQVAKTHGYSYHAWSSNQNLLRYDSPHPDHNKIHHRPG